MNNLIFLAIFLYGIAQAMFHDKFGVETNLVWYAQTASAIIIGGGVTVFNLKSYLGQLLSFLPKKQESPKSEQCFTPQDYESRDFDALVHLRNRCVAANSKEGVDTCAKLAGILFQLNITNDKVAEPNDKVAEPKNEVQ